MCLKMKVFAFLLTISSGFALTCYKCDSSQNKLCSYGISRFTYNTADCNEEFAGGAWTDWIPKQCVKIIAKDKDGGEYIARGCMPHTAGACGEIAKRIGFFGSLEGSIKDIDCVACDGDKCNSAAKFGGAAFLGVVLAAGALLF